MTAIEARIRNDFELLKNGAGIKVWETLTVPPITAESIKDGIFCTIQLLEGPDIALPEQPFILKIEIDNKYPIHPPSIHIKNTVPHSAVDDATGKLIHPVLSEAWSRSYNVSIALWCIRSLFLKAINPWELNSIHLNFSAIEISANGGQMFRSIFGHSQHIGQRESMEDTLLCMDFIDSANTHLGFSPSFFCVADGHNGNYCSTFIKNNIGNILVNELVLDEDLRKIMWNVILKLESKFSTEASLTSDSSGSTCVCLLHDGFDKIYCANVGDSRAILLSEGKVIQLTHDHKASDTDEASKIISRGGFVLNDRIFGRLAVSRAVGNLDCKRLYASALSAEPDISVITLQSPNDIVVIASDGLFDVMRNNQIMAYINKELHEGYSLSIIADNLVRMAVNEFGASDNTTAIIVCFSTDLGDQEIKSHCQKSTAKQINSTPIENESDLMSYLLDDSNF